jgi:hypothetical protein
MAKLVGLLVVSVLAAASPAIASSEPTPQAKDAVLQYVAPFQVLTGVSYGMSAVDSRPLFLDQRASTHVASGLRTVWYSCPNEAPASGGSRLSFEFEPGRVYELVCRAGQQAEIRAADC